MKPKGVVLKATDYFVQDVPLEIAQRLVRQHHYAKGGSNTAVFTHGLFRKDDPMFCRAVAWWLTPTKAAALANHPSNWQAVLALTRLVVIPGEPTNAASFLIAKSIDLIKRDHRWNLLLTFADTEQGHSGAIYRATNWTPAGQTKPTAI